MRHVASVVAARAVAGEDGGSEGRGGDRALHLECISFNYFRQAFAASVSAADNAVHINHDC